MSSRKKPPELTAVALAAGLLFGAGLLVAPGMAVAQEQPRSSIVETIKAVKDKIGGAAAPTAQPSAEARADQPQVILRLHGASTLGYSFIPKLAQTLLEQRGQRGVETVKTGKETVEIVGQGASAGKREAVEINSSGTSAAFAESLAFKHVGLEKKFADIGMAARPIKPEEAAKLKAAGAGEMTSPQAEHIVGLDGVALFTHPSNPVAGLSLDELRRIYLHEVSDWKDVHGVDANGKPVQGKAGPITVYCAHCRLGDGTYDFVKEKVLGGVDLDLAAPYIKLIDTYPDTQQALAGDSNGIGYASISFQSAYSKPLRISRGGEFIEPNAFNIKTGDYPLTRNVYLYTREKKSPLELQFIRLAYSPVGQQLLEQSGLVSAAATNKQVGSQASTQKQRLLDDPKIPVAYKELIRKADRDDTPYNLRFESGTGQLDNKSLIDLGRLVQTLQGKNATVVLVGFSDSRGDPAVNLKLSIERAQFVAEVLKTQGITRVETAGFGEEPALLVNPKEDSYEALKDNRRVEVWLKRAS